MCFIHPKGSDESPQGGEGVLIELVQAPPELVAKPGWRSRGNPLEQPPLAALECFLGDEWYDGGMRRAPRTRLLAVVLSALALVLVTSTPARATELRVVTFNVAMNLAFRKPFAGLIRSTFVNNEHLKRFDVIGLQEACQNDRAAIELFRGVMLRTHGRVYEHLVLADAQTLDSCRKAQVILSRYPIVRAGGMQLPRIGAWRSAAWVDLKVGADTVRVYNLHLSNRDGKNLTPVQGRWKQGKHRARALARGEEERPSPARHRARRLQRDGRPVEAVSPRAHDHQVLPVDDAEPPALRPYDVRSVSK